MYCSTGLLGFAMAIAPFAQGYYDNPTAMWISVILGGIVLTASIVEGKALKQVKWTWWVVDSTGLLAMCAPFIFGFTTLMVAQWTLMIVGAVIVSLASYELLFDLPPT